MFLMMTAAPSRCSYSYPRISGVLRSLLAQRFQRAAPRDNLIEHRVDRLLVMGSRLEDAEVFKVGKHGEQDLVEHGRDLHLGESVRFYGRQNTRPKQDWILRTETPTTLSLGRAGDVRYVSRTHARNVNAVR